MALGLKASVRSQVDPFMAMDVLAEANRRAAAGRDVVHLELGEPGEGPPPAVLAAAHAALDQPLGYTEALGRPALRQAIADHYRRVHDLAVDPEQVVVTTGASGAFILAFLAAFEPGDRIVVPEPAYPAYKNTLLALGLEVVRLGLGPATDFKPTVAQLAAVAGPIHGLILASPANPTGTMLTAAEQVALLDHCRRHGIRVVADEIYHGITYGEPATSALSATADALVINGFSKYFCMTGWRLGWLVAPPDLVRPIELLAQSLFISAPALAQAAALVALQSGAELDRRIAVYRRNRTALLDRLPAAGLERFAPVDGAFYLYADVSHLTDDSFAWARALLRDTGVALTPGGDFDAVEGQRFVRLSFAGAHHAVVEGADRLATWLTSHR